MWRSLPACRRGAVWFCCLSLVVAAAAADPPVTTPVQGLRNHTPRVFALQKARIVTAAGRVLDQATLVVREGLVESVGVDVAVPADATLIDCAGRTIYPGLIDAYSEEKSTEGPAVGGVGYWNEQVRPEFELARSYTPDAARTAALRRQGITTRLAAPAAGIIRGTSALVTTGEEAAPQALIRPVVALHLRLTVPPSRGRGDYPSSPMGAVALARQALYDAHWYRQAWIAYQAGSQLERPERNLALEALEAYLDAERLVICDAPNELYLLRADQFAREFGLRIAIRGSGREYRRLDAVAATGRPIIVPVDFPKPPHVATAEAAHRASLEDLLHWDLAPENPGRLVRAGVRIAFTSAGLKDINDFLPALRKAVARGLTADEALRALTETPAQLFGCGDRLGSLEAGKQADFIVTDGELFAEKTRILETWVAGRRLLDPLPPWQDARGTWRVTLPLAGQSRTAHVEIGGSLSEPRGTLREAAAAAETAVPLKQVALRDARLSFTFDTKVFGQPGTAQVTAVLSAAADGRRTWEGWVLGPDGQRGEVPAERTGDAPESAGAEPPTDPSKAPADQGPKSDTSLPASYAVNFPLGSFGRDAPPEQPAALLLRHATIWTCGPAGVLEDASLLVAGGQIVAVGHDLPVPPGALVLDLAGKHITPGIIDCHSHMATDGGVNEGTQAITAEVRIGDFIDPDDITIYRQLAGGVTSANILHGSANPIGGQNQVIKLRWGALPEALKMAEAPSGIKFALGENVKQSNWGDNFTSRYPQTRMGVEQLMRDAFLAARQYRDQWHRWQSRHEGLPPRRDLELEALVEILEGKRWIHCHSYRQDEILAFLRVLEEFQVQIGSLQHILEGYKVADAMARHGAMGSAFSDWWAYKFEVFDAIPYNGALMHRKGVVVSFNSDDAEMGRHLNHEAAKAVKYGGVPPVEALQFVTLNPARQLRIDGLVGSLEAGKQADLVVWSGPPLSTLSRCEQTWIDGRKYFDIQEDLAARERIRQMRTTLLQKVLASGESMQKPDEEVRPEWEFWPRRDTFCHCHGGGEIMRP